MKLSSVFFLLIVVFFFNPTVQAQPAKTWKTGQTDCYDISGNVIDCTGTGQDGEVQAGATWPSPRFEDNGNGTITDHLTGLVWLKNANCFGAYQHWVYALDACNNLHSGNCGLTDGSVAGDWRLPNLKELRSLVDYSQFNPALPQGHLFEDVQSANYWSADTLIRDLRRHAWVMDMIYGAAYHDWKYSGDYYIWPVRGGKSIAADIIYSDRVPDISQTTLPPDGQLKDLTGNGIDPLKPTVVINHGWNPDYPIIHTEPGQTPTWIRDMADEILNRGIDVNIVWWDWLEQASSKSSAHWAGASSNAPSQGDALAYALHIGLGTNYNQTLHFIGHSMGARVSKTAADTLHGYGYDSNKTHVTILDAAEFSDLDYNSWDKSIPRQAAWIDNYISAFADLHPESVNVILRQGMPVTINPGLIGLIESLASFHHYSVAWYINSIRNPYDSDMGFRWTFETGGLYSPSPGIGSCFVQTLNPLDSELTLDLISMLEAETIMLGRNALHIAEGGLLVLNLMKGPVEAVGSVTGELYEKAVDGVIDWTLRLVFEEASPAYAWIPATIPNNAEFISFDFLVNQIGDGDYLSFGINSDSLFMIEIDHVEPHITTYSGHIDISQYSGKDVELFLGLNSLGDANAKIIVDNIRFHSIIIGDHDRDWDIDGSDLVSFISAYESGNTETTDLKLFIENYGTIIK